MAHAPADSLTGEMVGSSHQGLPRLPCRSDERDVTSSRTLASEGLVV